MALHVKDAELFRREIFSFSVKCADWKSPRNISISKILFIELNFWAELSVYS